MAAARTPEPVLLVVATFSRHEQALRWGRDELERLYGPAGLAAPPFSFHETAYYERQMGPGLPKQLLAFRDLVAPDALAGIKLRTNGLEEQLAGSGLFPETRPLNLDPGYLTLGKLVLATTKDQAHRVYLRDGIFAEVTLQYRYGEFAAWPWTYADYRRPEVHTFLREARAYYQDRLRAVRPGDTP